MFKRFNNKEPTNASRADEGIILHLQSIGYQPKDRRKD
jgi:hypothetical protein